MPTTVEAVLIGAGQRGALDYAPYALRNPDQLRFVAVAEPNAERRKRFADLHRIPNERRFESWEDLLDRSQIAQAALICTQDQMHTQPALTALRIGYDVLLEKPMATTAEECRRLVSTAIEMGRQLHVCHVLRYTNHFQRMHEILNSDVLGQIINIDHRENVSWWHMAHSYVRGNWAVETRSCPMILAKCCHDFDMLLWILRRACNQLSSVGSLVHFHAWNAPPGTPERCLDGCPEEERCPYFAPFIYSDLIPLWRTLAETSTGWEKQAITVHLRAPWLTGFLSRFIPPLQQISDYRGWPRSVLDWEPNPENLMRALRTGPYGRCVYHCDNDVVDHQVVLMEFEGGISATLTMQGHSHLECRTTRIEGSRASLDALFSLGGSWIKLQDHRSGRTTHLDTSPPLAGGHSGGDEGLMRAFVQSLHHGWTEEAQLTIQQALESHLMAFASEEARRARRVVQMKEYHTDAGGVFTARAKFEDA
jgi:predicted dehydrogenase